MALRGSVLTVVVAVPLPPLPPLPLPPLPDPLVVVAYVLLLAGVAASVLPGPSGLLSLAGLYLHWWHVGRPGPVGLALLTLVALAALVADWVGGPAAARASGVPTRRALAGGVVGLLAGLVTGPVGLVVGLALTIFVLEYRDAGDPRQAARRAGAATLGILAAAAVQLVATTVVLVGVLLA